MTNYTIKPLKKISILGGNARNKGALLMLENTINILRESGVETFYIFTPYPSQDKKFIEKYKNTNLNVFLVKWDPKNIIISYFYSLIKSKKTKINSSIFCSDLVLDISGISFVENRGLKYLIYNSLTVLIPFNLGKKIIKLPQSFGPLNSKFYKFVSRKCLSKCKVIFSRGLISKKTLDEIGIKNIQITDLGFARNIDASDNKTNVIGIQPSIVVKKYFKKINLDYEIFLSKLIDKLLKLNFKIIVFPQSYSQIESDYTFNDSIIINMLEKKFLSNNSIEFINNDLSLEEIFEIYQKLDICITSRFHGMITSLMSEVPVIVIGWNHKYEEILMDFNLEKFSLDISTKLEYQVLELLDLINKEYTEIKFSIKSKKSNYKKEKEIILSSLME